MSLLKEIKTKHFRQESIFCHIKIICFDILLDLQVYTWNRLNSGPNEVLSGHSMTVNYVSWKSKRLQMLAFTSDDRTFNGPQSEKTCKFVVSQNSKHVLCSISFLLIYSIYGSICFDFLNFSSYVHNTVIVSIIDLCNLMWHQETNEDK